ncbi:hypothetical protein ACHAXA_000697 [Cyclostephanos tholiformis]|uniref:Uncharacterized protein n=1 Tax=Cyclostephanos tholiformis TaxID=382380 RepID=A0ABD3R4V5_9STRA
MASDVLIQIEVQVLSNEECGGAYNDFVGTTITNDACMFCAMDDGQDICQGYSSEPMIIRDSDGDI